jgi:hypothetical protein
MFALSQSRSTFRVPREFAPELFESRACLEEVICSQPATQLRLRGLHERFESLQ